MKDAIEKCVKKIEGLSYKNKPIKDGVELMDNKDPCFDKLKKSLLKTINKGWHQKEDKDDG